MSYKWLDAKRKKDIAHIKVTAIEEMAKAKIIEESLLKKEKLTNDKKLPVDVQIKKHHMKTQFENWNKNPDKPTKKSILEVNKKLNNPIYNY